MLTAIVLAAGKSERMGSPKALLPCRGTTFLENILAVIGRSSIAQTVVVLGHHRDEISRRVEVPNAVYNPDYELGMTTSLQAGIRGLPGAASAAMLFLVDHPLVRTETIERLISAGGGGSIVVPMHQGRRGHPVLFRRDVLEEILALPAGVGANTVVRARPERVVEVPVEDPGVLTDVDTPRDFERLDP